MKRIQYCLISVMVMFSLLIISVVGCAKPAPEELPPIKVGVLIPYTGPGVFMAPYLDDGVELAFDEVGWEIEGRKVITISEDETVDPAICVSKAKKLVEQDKVDVILGPMLGHTSQAVAAWASPVGVPVIDWADNNMKFCIENKTYFQPLGAGRGNTYYGGVYAYEKLGCRTAWVLSSDYEGGWNYTGGFIDGFKDAGGEVVDYVMVPLGTSDMAAYIAKIPPDIDVISTFFAGPNSVIFPKQLREYGLKMPLFLATMLTNEEPELLEIGDNAIGMYGQTTYTPLIDTPANNEFVKRFYERYEYYPETCSMQAYVSALCYIAGVKATGGDTSWDKMVEALSSVKFDTPRGEIQMTADRMGIGTSYVVQVVKMGERLAWKPLKEYTKTKPR